MLRRFDTLQTEVSPVFPCLLRIKPLTDHLTARQEVRFIPLTINILPAAHPFPAGIILRDADFTAYRRNRVLLQNQGTDFLIYGVNPQNHLVLSINTVTVSTESTTPLAWQLPERHSFLARRPG